MLKATIIGNLGGDPEARHSADGKPFLRMNVAANYRTRGPDGEWQDRTEWVRVTVIGPRAESLGQHLRKGSRIYAEGRLEARPWTDQQGQLRAGLEVVATEVEFVTSRADDEARMADAPRVGGSRETAATTGESTRPGRPSGQRPQPAPVDAAEPEDLPF